MTELEAIKARHSVRKYLDRPIERAKLERLREEIAEINPESGLNVQLVQDEPKAFSSGMWKYGQFSGVRYYFVMAGPKGKEAEEKIGRYGEKLVLLAQILGLNTCWVGLTYKIALGYGTMPGVQHPRKPAENFYESEGIPPEWFKEGLEAALLAPTAVNQQKFKFILHPGNVVEAKTLFSMAGYTAIDLGIVKYHFEVGAGKENFTWMV